MSRLVVTISAVLVTLVVVLV
ncbi:MAG: hypothetical protein QOJ63_2911, partial [Solirubrobacteraceae bacterium]|nr:hypothetical protein [Solirubrobacteraceae bacterium]